MRSILNPKWLLLVNTAPVVVLVGLLLAQFQIIRTLLPAGSVAVWHGVGAGIVGLALLTLAYALLQWKRGRELSTGYGVTTLVLYSALVCLGIYFADDLVPWSIPRWLVPTEPALYILTFLMPTVAHAGFGLVVRLTPPDQAYSVPANLGLALAAPLLWYGVLLLPGSLISSLLGHWLPDWVQVTLLVTGLALGTVLFLLFLVRVVYILDLRRGGTAWPVGVGWKLLVGLVLPVLGLLVNNGVFWGNFGSDEAGIFGNFHAYECYALAVLNGGLLCLPPSPHRWWRLAQLAGRSALLTYTGYFFLVFLPFLPLSMLAVLLIGTGFLMLTPLVLLVVHVREVAADWQQLHQQVPGWARGLALGGGLLVLPLLLTARYLHDRHTLHQALDYRYSPNYAAGPVTPLDTAALARTLAVVRQHKERSVNQTMFGQHVPYLSMYFNWLVLDNLTLSDGKLADLEQVFLGQLPPAESAAEPRPALLPAAPVLADARATSTYDARQQAWVSQVELRVQNTDPNEQAGEYATRLELPAGCWVGDYYLDMNGRREHGILAEKKAAAWVYAQILQEQTARDPGLLTYQTDRQLSLRVYPVVGRTPRVTGFQLLHKEPVRLVVDGRPLQLGPAYLPAPLARPVSTPGGEVVYVGAAAKQRLPLVQRRPYLHFLLDATAKPAARARYAAVLEQQFGAAALRHPATRFTLVDAYATPVPAGRSWGSALAEHPAQGGFYLDGALRQLLAQAHRQPRATYPIPVVVTDSLPRAILGPDLAELRAAYPESDRFYVLGADGHLRAHSLQRAAARPLEDVTGAALLAARPAVRAWPSVAHPQAYLANDGAAEVVLARPAAAMRPALAAGGRWTTGLLLHGYQQWQAFHPEATDAQRGPFVQASFRAGILTPFTAYLALENEAQKAALQRKQEQVLNGKAALDAGEEPDNQPTAVPLDDYAPALLVLALLLAWWHLRRPRLTT